MVNRYDGVEAIGNTRIVHALKGNNMDTFDEVLYRLERNPFAWMEWKNFGEKSYEILMAFLKENDLEPKDPMEFRSMRRAQIFAPFYEYKENSKHRFSASIDITDLRYVLKAVFGYNPVEMMPEKYDPIAHALLKDIIKAEESKLEAIWSAARKVRELEEEVE